MESECWEHPVVLYFEGIRSEEPAIPFIANHNGVLESVTWE